MFKRVIRGGLLLTLLLLVGIRVEAQSSVSFLPNGSLTGVTSTGTSTVFTVPVLFPDGAQNAPSLSFSSTPTAGIYYRPNPYFLMCYNSGNYSTWCSNNSALTLNGTAALSWTAARPGDAASDVFLYRDAANTLALRNGTAAQEFRVYNTYTDTSNYSRGYYKWVGNFLYIGGEAAGSGTYSGLVLGGGTVLSASTISPSSTDSFDLGANSPLLWKSLYLSRSVQGSKSKALTDNTATAFVRLSVADDDYEGCGVIYTAYAEDTATDARQTRTGKVYAAILNNSGTEAVAFSTGDSAVSVTAGTFTCTFDGNSAVADTIDLRATCDTSLAATTTLTFEYRLDCPSTVTVTPQ